MTVARLTSLLALLGAIGTLGAASTSAAEQAAPGLRYFSGCGDFLAHVKPQAVKVVGPYGLSGGAIALAADRAAAPTPGVDYSTTNVQEQGVDEPDIVKTDGEKIVALAQGKLRVVVLGKDDKPDLVASLAVEGAGLLLLHRNRAVVVSHTYGGRPLPADTRLIAPVPTQTVLTEIDLSAPSRPRVVRTLTLDASYLDARLVGSSLRVVLTSPPPIAFEPPSEPGPKAERAALERNRAQIRSSRAREWLPSYTLRNRRTGAKRTAQLLGCSHVARPSRFSGLGILSVVTFDLARGLVPVDTDGVMTDGQMIYASKSSLYVATQRWTEPGELENGKPPRQTTALHRFDISDPLRARYRASGDVNGYVINQFAMSELDGVLRVATTEFPLWWGGAQTDSESSVTTFEQRGGQLVRLGRQGGLGRGERIFGVRFIGDVGYVVTFRQVDPLYVVDLSRPSDPVIRGELKIRGYSAYLHPLGPDLLLGLGQDATDEGRVLGTQVSTFDVSDPRQPALLRRVTLGKAWSEAEWDHHAFLYWPRATLAVLPVQASLPGPNGTEKFFSAAVALRARRTALDVEGMITHPGSAGIRRSLVIGDVLYTLSDSGLKGSSLGSFATRSWTDF
jgi:Beta propeller domain